MKSQKHSENFKKLDLNDRLEIELGLIHGETFKQIAQRLGRHPISISREVRNNRTSVPAHYPFDNDCKYAVSCFKTQLCGRTICRNLCRNCSSMDCKDFCGKYVSTACHKTDIPPYVCNSCRERRSCIHKRYYYDFKTAQKLADQRRSDSRKGIQIHGTEFDLMDKTISTLLRKGQPIAHICATQMDSIPVCQRSVYNYIEHGELRVKSSDLRRRNGYRKRKIGSSSPKGHTDQQYRKGRTYTDFKAFMVGQKLSETVEMDTVKGSKGTKGCLLTILFTSCNLMLLFLMPDGTQESVTRVFDYLELILGLERFRRLFKVILTDNGGEFKDVDGIELTAKGELRTRVFYCDPMASWQKAHIEKNHEYIRYAIPKGTDLTRFTQDDITLLANHINSTVRPGFGNRCPYDMVSPADTDMNELMKVLNLQRIAPSDLNLTKGLFSLQKEV